VDILEDVVMIEVVDERHRPVPPGVPGHGAKLKLVKSTLPAEPAVLMLG
jgi:hypothetical protein